MKFAKDIPGYEGRYAVDMIGNVFSYRSKIVLKPAKCSGGYLSVLLGRANTKNLHTLVLNTFIGPRPSKNHVCRHLDGNKLNNDLFNLEWATYSQNALDKKKHGVDYKLRIPQIEEIKELLEDGYSYALIAEWFNVSKSTIANIKWGKVHRDVLPLSR